MTVPERDDLGVYIHWPYCARICPYCDFNVVRERGREIEKAGLVDAIVSDLAAHAALTGYRRLRSIFFGGGTPSLMSPESIALIVQAACRLWPAAADLEITLEANPTDAEAARFADIAAAGVQRLSLGVQSLDDRSLVFLGRNHDAQTARRAIDIAAQSFERLSIDLIYALPSQTVPAWIAELKSVASLCEHISAYQLSIEPGAAFHRAVKRAAFFPASDDVAAELYGATQAVLEGAGFDAYEVSNHARGLAARSRHNLVYWRGGDYVGVGPGAHGRLTIDGERWSTVAPDRVADYVARVGKSPIGSVWERLPPTDVAIERLLMGLRTSEGVGLCEIKSLRIPRSRFVELSDLLIVEEGRLVATAPGRLVLDRLVVELTSGSTS